jgi:alcohol dehydrogenase YqhD (iron-dependent ADH family)
MDKFEFYNPVRIVFGVGELSRVGEEAKKLGKKALLVTYKDHRYLDPAIQQVQSLLHAAGVELTTYFGASPNPKIAEAAEGVKICKDCGAEFVIGLGGGSAMDCAKLVAAGVFHDGDLWNMVFSRHDNSLQAVPPVRALPLLMVPTLPATGSEMNPTAVVTNQDTLEKSYTWSPCLYPQVSIVDPQLTCSLPPYQTACAAADTMSHVLEFYLTGYEDAFLNNRIQEGVMQTVLEYAPRVLKDPQDVSARGHLQWAAIVGLNGWSQPGDGWTPMHQLGHVLSAQFDVAHGASLAIVMPAWMKYFYKTRLGQYAGLAVRVFGVQPIDDLEKAALEGIARFETFLKEIGVPTRLADIQVDEKAISTLTTEVVKISFGADGKLRSRPPASRDDVEAVFRLALQ